MPLLSLLSPRAWRMVVAVLVVGLAISWQLGRLDIQRQASEQRGRVVRELAEVRAQLEGTVKAMVNSTEGLVSLLALRGTVEPELVDDVARKIIERNPHVRNVAVAPDDQVNHVYPLRGNEKVLGFRFATRPEQMRTVALARERRQPILAGPVPLVQGGRGLIHRAPVFRADASLGDYWGVVSIVANVDPLLQAGGLASAPDLEVALRGQDGAGAQGKMMAGEAQVFQSDPVTALVEVPGGDWQLGAVPRGGWGYRSVYSSNYFRLGLVASLLLTAGVFLFLRRERDAARIQSLQSANATLDLLGTIGRELTGHLQSADIFASLCRHAQPLLDAQAVMLWLTDAEGKTLSLHHGWRQGVHLATDASEPVQPDSPAARCCREGRRLVLNGDYPAEDNSPSVSAPSGRSQIYLPLQSNQTLLGVLGIETANPEGFGEQASLVLETLAAYTAIALSNHRSIAALNHAQVQVTQAEKMALLGQLVANVAHEINTPIAAIKSSGHTMSGALTQALTTAPALARRLPADQAEAFLQLLALLQRPRLLLDSRSEREALRALSLALESHGTPLPRPEVEQLLACGIRGEDLPQVDAVLHSPGRVELLEAAHHLAAAIGSAATINSAVEGVTRIVFALKAYARQSTQLEAVETDLAACLDTVLTLYQNQIRRGIELVKQIEPVPRIWAHPDELNQVWTNLVHNALQAMGGSGTLTVSLKSRDGFVVVAVGDTGRGIPAEIQSRIFDPFFTTKAMGEGSGLGLNTAKAIVEKHRGQIQFTSQPGRGTVFSVSLPLP